MLAACGFATGALRLLKAVDLSDEPNGHFADSFAKILFIEFADDGTKLATADGEGVICLYRNNTQDWNKTWVYVGCHQSHTGAVLNLAFVREVGVEKDRLFTLGLDGCLVEYDLDQSADGDLLIQYREMIDSEDQPFAFALYPPISKESFLITSNNKYKLRLWNVTTKLCRKTVNGPLQGSPVMGMTALPLREGNSSRYLLWRNADCVGLMALPLDGNPYRYCSRRVHPLGITCMKPSPSGRFVFTAGGPEAIVNMWSLHPEILDASLEASKDSLIPFFDLLEGGMDGELYKRLEQYFVYLQLKMQGLETREARVVQDVLPLQELPNLFCALSYYPSEQEKKNIMQEIKYSQYAETGLLVDQVDVPTALKTFVNHRPIWGIQYPDLIKAFAKFGFEELRTCIKPPQLVQILKGIGESMSEEEAVNTLSVLTNLRPPLADWEGVGAERDFFRPGTTLPKEFTVKDVIEEVFGFETTDAFYGPPDNSL
ncbi:hypothetical protein RvY_03161-2 [Ramazzottius varieornatus]|uniref:Cilia- and flagella-associated protein 251 n=1 Tax=Ramazzottius varieornatus TaxID=947166 RepID=A0A1D1USV0_RAMVA|nr:hypothetical protein RvY_03161-2 [Ramazzottius varieornatus]